MVSQRKIENNYQTRQPFCSKSDPMNFDPEKRVGLSRLEL